jgi:hypothetical protein
MRILRLVFLVGAFALAYCLSRLYEPLSAAALIMGLVAERDRPCRFTLLNALP